jgi:hypothetical protein
MLVREAAHQILLQAGSLGSASCREKHAAVRANALRPAHHLDDRTLYAPVLLNQVHKLRIGPHAGSMLGKCSQVPHIEAADFRLHTLGRSMGSVNLKHQDLQALLGHNNAMSTRT